jgi:hypothetical protein
MVLPPGHHREVTSKRSFSRFEKWTLTSVVVVLVVFAIVFVIAASGPGPTTARGCVDVSILGATGAAAIHQCGADARSLCRAARRASGPVGENTREIQAACRKDGFG